MSELDNQQVLLSLLDQVQEDPEGILADTGLQPVLGKGEEILDLDESFDFEGFQVVRREFFAHQSEPSVTFNNCKFYVNSACLTKFPTVQYVHVKESSAPPQPYKSVSKSKYPSAINPSANSAENRRGNRS